VFGASALKEEGGGFESLGDQTKKSCFLVLHFL